MKSEHAAAFELALADVVALYDGPPLSDAALRLWWSALEPFPWPLVAQALQAHVARCKFAPKPADILERLETSDGRPSPDEAWAVAVAARDEAETVIWTAETAEAWGLAHTVLDLGDEVGARRAFIDSYTRLVGEARRALLPVTWSASLGSDPQRRGAALARALKRRQLPPAQVQALLPGPLAAPDSEISAVAGLLAGNVTSLPDLQQRNARRFLAIVNEALAAHPPPASVAGATSDTAARKAAAKAALAAWQERHG